MLITLGNQKVLQASLVHAIQIFIKLIILNKNKYLQLKLSLNVQ